MHLAMNRIDLSAVSCCTAAQYASARSGWSHSLMRGLSDIIDC